MTETLATILKARTGRDRRRIGRGIGSGRGKTSGYGHKGARARSGGTKCAFEGGQMPIYRRLPKRGFTPLTSNRGMFCLNLLDLQRLVDVGKLKTGDHVTLESLKTCGVLRNSAQVIRLLGKGKLSVPLKISVDYVTPSASQAVVAAGGEILSTRVDA
ncbi:MAG: 50S ribosomal protein L15 [Holosporales bacterium]|jgi:large subunit ribosomal protein L15|nr:50S ribosomal protein L15 [Holosporales bacterium]